MRKQLDPYRTPPNPGYIGGYNWRAMFAGFALLLIFNATGTQYIASRFAYQPALGVPIFRTASFALYEPFAWSIRYAGSANPRIRLPVQFGVLIVTGGCIATIGAFFVLNMRRTRRLSRDTEDIHG